MKKLFVSLAALALVFAVSSCRETEKKADEMSEDVENVMEDAKEEAEEVMEETEETVDSMANEVEEVVEEVEETVEN
jgi:gas vesicle protein